MSRVIFFDRAGMPLDEIEVNVTRTWRMIEIGQASFEVALGNPKCTEKNLRYGNYVLVVGSGGLPDWGGVIDTPREWGNNSVKVTAYEPLYMLKWRHDLLNGTTDNRHYSAGVMFSDQIIASANASEDLRLRVERISDPGTDIGLKFDSDFYTVLKNLLDKTDLVVFSEPRIDKNHRLYFALFCVPAATVNENVTSIALVQGLNISAEDDALTEDGQTRNMITAIGFDSQNNKRRISTLYDPETRTQYGLRMSAENFSGDASEESLANFALKRLRELYEPQLLPNVEAFDQDDLFDKLRLGNTLKIIFPRSGFRSGGVYGKQFRVQIIEMEKSDSVATVRLTLKAFNDKELKAEALK